MRLFRKFFLAFLLTVTISVVLMVTALHWFLRQGFADFVDTMDTAALTSAAEILESRYDAETGWSRLDDRGRGLDWIVRRMSAMHRAAGPHPERPPRHGPARRHVSLYDADGYVVAGRDQPLGDIGVKVPITRDGATIGWLGMSRPQRFDRPDDARFIDRQRNALLVGAGLILLVSTLASALLARNLTRPIRRVAEGTSRLAAGHFDTRIRRQTSDEVGDLADNFNQLGQALEQHEGTRRRWFAEIAHELRTPLTSLHGELEALRDGVRPTNAEAIESLYRESSQLAHLIDDLQALALSDAGALNYRMTTVDVASLVRDALAAVRHSLSERALRIRDDLPDAAAIRGDRERLRQLIDNLLRNAIAHTDDPGEIHIALRREAQSWRLSIEDTAPGVSPAELDHLFEPFYRVAGRAASQSGSGLGLAICRKIVQAHGGVIRATPSAHGGLRLDVDLPA